jgi:hypothetical protein
MFAIYFVVLVLVTNLFGGTKVGYLKKRRHHHVKYFLIANDEYHFLFSDITYGKLGSENLANG